MAPVKVLLSMMDIMSVGNGFQSLKIVLSMNEYIPEVIQICLRTPSRGEKFDAF